MASPIASARIRNAASVATFADVALRETGEHRGFGDGVVRLIRHVDRAVEEVLGQEPPARGDERREIRERAAAREHAPGVAREAGHRAEPADDVRLDCGEPRRGGEDADVAVRDAGNEVRHGGVGQAAARDVGEIARAGRVEALRDHAGEEEVQELLRRPPRLGERRPERARELRSARGVGRGLQRERGDVRDEPLRGGGDEIPQRVSRELERAVFRQAAHPMRAARRSPPACRRATRATIAGRSFAASPRVSMGARTRTGSFPGRARRPLHVADRGERPRHDGHDRDAGREREAEGAALEGEKLRSRVAVPLGHEPDGEPLPPHRLRRALERVERRSGVVAVDDQIPREAVEPAEDGDPSDLALAGRHRALREDRAERDDVGEALVVGHDDAGAEILEALAVLDGDVPAHHLHDAAAEDPAVDVERLAISRAEEQPDDAQARAEEEPEHRRRRSRDRKPPAPSLRTWSPSCPSRRPAAATAAAA